jgi:uncharacterized protein YndB with AHSA1/START domain
MNTTENKLTVSFPSDTEILMTRVLNAPKSLVYECFTQCEHLGKWWGQEITDCEMDLRVGGQWRRTSKSPDGNVTPFKGVYKEVVPQELLSYTMIMGAEPNAMPEILETILFHEEGGQTKLSTIVKVPSKEMLQGMAPHMEKGASWAYDKLEKHLNDLRS